jgi:hypothetical protein
LPPESNGAVFDAIEGRRAASVRLVGLVALLLWAVVGPVAPAAGGDRQAKRSNPSELWSEFPLQPSEPAVSSTHQSGLTQSPTRHDASGVVSEPSESFDWALPVMLAAGAGLTTTVWLGVAALRRNGREAPSMRAPAVRRARTRRAAGGIRYHDY